MGRCGFYSTAWPCVVRDWVPMTTAVARFHIAGWGVLNIYVTNGSLSSKVADKINETCFVILERLPRMVNLLNTPEYL